MVVNATTRFTQTAHVVVGKVEELLNAQAIAIDRYGTVIASSEPQHVGLSLNQTRPTNNYLRVPFRFASQMGEVVVGKPRNGETISPRLAQVLVELVINQTTVLERLPNQHELKNQFIYDLLHGQITDESTVLTQAKRLGLDFNPPRAVILIDAADYINTEVSNLEDPEASRRRRAQLVVGSVVNFFHLPDDNICTHLGDGEVVVLKASNSKNLGRWAEDGVVPEPSSASWSNLTALKRAGDALLMRLRSDTAASISIGIGRYHPGILGLSRSYQDARMALSLGRRFNGQNQVYCLDRLGIAAFACVADEQTKIDLAMHLLSPLDHEPDLLATLEAFFDENCCSSTTAKQLSIHRNTLSYRLDKLASLTGLDPRRFDDAVQIRLALLLRKLQHCP